MCPVWAACSKPRRVVLIQGLTKTELPEAPGGAKQRITAEPSLRVQAAHLCGCCASNPDINSSKFHKTSENIYSLPVWFWQFRRRLVRFVQNDNGGTTNARTETSECIIKLYKVIWCLQSSSSLPIISGVWAQTLRHNSAMAQSDLQLPTLWQACHQSCTFSSFGFYIILHLLFSWEIMHYSGLHGSWSNTVTRSHTKKNGKVKRCGKASA